MPELTAEMLEESGITPETRSYMLSMDDIARFCGVYRNICDRLPFIFEYDYRDPENIKKHINRRIVVTEMVEDRLLNDSFGTPEVQNVMTKPT